MSANQWRAWIASHAAAEKRVIDDLRENPPSRQQSIASALELLRVWGEMHPDPFEMDAVTVEEDERVRQTWGRLRAAWRNDR